MSTGSVKLMLLLLGTLSFAAIWSNDQRPAVAPRMTVAGDAEWTSSLDAPRLADGLGTPLPRIGEAEATQHDSWFHFPAESGEPRVAAPIVRPESTEWVQLDETEFVSRTNVADDVPLPHAIAPGEYRVIDRWGNVLSRKISIEIAGATGFEAGSVERDVYTARKNGERWHFIRIETEPVSDRARQDLRAGERRAWKSLFRVLGAKTRRPWRIVSEPLENWLSADEVAESASSTQLR
jgi:hypothetical protein